MILRDKAGLWCLGDGLSCFRDWLFCWGIGAGMNWINCFGATWEDYWLSLVRGWLYFGFVGVDWLWGVDWLASVFFDLYVLWKGPSVYKNVFKKIQKIFSSRIRLARTIRRFWTNVRKSSRIRLRLDSTLQLEGLIFSLLYSLGIETVFG